MVSVTGCASAELAADIRLAAGVPDAAKLLLAWHCSDGRGATGRAGMHDMGALRCARYVATGAIAESDHNWEG